MEAIFEEICFHITHYMLFRAQLQGNLLQKPGGRRGSRKACEGGQQQNTAQMRRRKLWKGNTGNGVANLQHVSLSLLYNIHLPASIDTYLQLPSHSYRMECRIQEAVPIGRDIQCSPHPSLTKKLRHIIKDNFLMPSTDRLGELTLTLGNPFQSLITLLGEEMLPAVWSESPLAQLGTIPTSPVTGYLKRFYSSCPTFFWLVPAPPSVLPFQFVWH